jgi:hypothetical protein
MEFAIKKIDERNYETTAFGASHNQYCIRRNDCSSNANNYSDNMLNPIIEFDKIDAISESLEKRYIQSNFQPTAVCYQIAIGVISDDTNFFHFWWLILSNR